jgi:hypothetical protein
MTLAPDRRAETIRSGTVDPAEAGEPWWSYRRPPAPLARPGATRPLRTPPASGLRDAKEPSRPSPTSPAKASPSSLDLDRTPPSAAVPLGGAVAVTLILLLCSRLQIGGVGTVLVPLAALLYASAFARAAKVRHPDEPFYGRWVLYGVLVKLSASWFRYYTLQNTYDGQGDATGYDTFGREFARAWLSGGPEPFVEDLRRTNFIRWFTGVVYYLFGTNMQAGFFLFGMLALIGSVLWYRATVDAVPLANKRLYLGLVLFAPSIAFWPSSIGKESLMQLGIGIVALGTSIVLRGRLLRGLLVALPGGWLLWVVRPHLLALVTLASGVAYLTGRLRNSSSGAGSLLSRPGGAVIVALLMVFTVSQGAKFLGIESLSLASIEAELDEQTERSAQGGSEFDNGGNSLNPIYLPRGAATVLLRPFPWETDSPLQLISSLESAMLGGLILLRLGSVRLSLSRARRIPFLIYAWTLTLAYSMTFSSFANFGLLVRQRSLVLPALFVLLVLEPRALDRAEGDEFDDDEVPASRAEIAAAGRTGGTARGR